MTSPSFIAYLALGSNLGDRRAALEFAIESLHATPGIRVTKVSRMIETDPVGEAGQNRYLNAAVEARVALTPRQLLDRCLAIERLHGRVRSDSSRWGPRTLDIDILLYGDRVIDEPSLHVPHPRLHERAFVLIPLAEIAPDARHPRLGQSIQSLLQRLPPAPEPEYLRGEPCSFS